MDMNVKYSRDRMGLLFMEYISILQTYGLKWVIDNNPKTEVAHVLSEIQPTQLPQRLESDLLFSH